MGKVMISLTDEAEELVREEVGKLYYGRTGGFSIFFEHLIRQYFNGHIKEKKSKYIQKPDRSIDLIPGENRRTTLRVSLISRTE